MSLKIIKSLPAMALTLTGIILCGCPSYQSAVKESAKLVVEDYRVCVVSQDCTERDEATNRIRLQTAAELCCLLEIPECCEVK